MQKRTSGMRFAILGLWAAACVVAAVEGITTIAVKQATRTVASHAPETGGQR